MITNPVGAEFIHHMRQSLAPLHDRELDDEAARRGCYRDDGLDSILSTMGKTARGEFDAEALLLERARRFVLDKRHAITDAMESRHA